jgi:hypothetical protein
MNKTNGTTNCTKNLIEAMINYGLHYLWCDTEIIDMLVVCGVTEEDFKEYGYWEYVKEYFEEQ